MDVFMPCPGSNSRLWGGAMPSSTNHVDNIAGIRS